MNLTLKDKLFSKLDTPILQLLFFSISVTLLIYVNYYVYNWFFKFSLLGGQIYHQKIIAWEGLRLWRDRLPIVYITLACLLFFWRLSWSKLGLEKSVRILIITCVFIFAWKFSTYDYNLYLSHGHYWDRALLILLALGVYLHPALLPVFLYFLYPMVFQFESPLGLYSWTDKYIPVNILSIFTSYLLISIIRKPSTASLLFTFLCMMGAYYLYPGVGKMKMGPHWYTWMFENELPNLIVSGWLNGWGWWLSEDFVIKFANFFEYLNVPSQIATMIIELGSVFLLFGRRVSSLLLVAFIALHLMIFLTSGIFFWKWIAVDICMIYIIWNLKEQTYRTLFSPFAAIAALPVIIYGNHYFDVIELGWLDSRVNHMYEFEAVDRKGDVWDIGRNFFSPYDLTFSQNRFYHLSDDPLIADTFGSVYRYDKFRAYQDNFEQEGSKYFPKGGMLDERRNEVFDSFIQSFFRTWNRRKSKSSYFSYIPGFQHIYMKGRKKHFYDKIKSIKLFRVRLVQTYYDGKSIKVLTDKVIREIKIPR